MRDRRLKEVPALVESVASSIKVLDAGNNQLSRWPACLEKASSLQRIVLSSNLIAEINGPSLLPCASTLKILLLDGNQLTSLPDELALLVKLERLSLSNNKLHSLPSVIGSLPNLSLLDVSRNQLSSLPDSMGQLENLEELDASDNRLTLIPPSLGSLHKLKTLALNKCLIKAVPSEVFINCISLQTLSLHGNPIKPETVHETEGFAQFEKRRQEKFTKGIQGGVVFGSLDEGVDRKLK